VQHPCCIAHAARLPSHRYDRLFPIGRWSGVGILQENCAPTLRARATPLALLPFRRPAMPDALGSLARGAVQHWGNHRSPHSDGWVSSSVRGEQIHSFETPFVLKVEMD